MYGGIELSMPLCLVAKAFLLCYSKNNWFYSRKSSAISECRSIVNMQRHYAPDILFKIGILAEGTG